MCLALWMPLGVRECNKRWSFDQALSGRSEKQWKTCKITHFYARYGAKSIWGQVFHKQWLWYVSCYLYQPVKAIYNRDRPVDRHQNAPSCVKMAKIALKPRKCSFRAPPVYDLTIFWCFWPQIRTLRVQKRLIWASVSTAPMRSPK